MSVVSVVGLMASVGLFGMKDGNDEPQQTLWLVFCDVPSWASHFLGLPLADPSVVEHEILGLPLADPFVVEHEIQPTFLKRGEGHGRLRIFH
jgi:hypothetical protein